MIENLSCGHQRESHAEPQQSTGVRNVGDPGDLLVLQELFNWKYCIYSLAGLQEGHLTVGVLDEGVEADEVVLGVAENLVGQGTILSGAVGLRLPVSGAALRPSNLE